MSLHKDQSNRIRRKEASKDTKRDAHDVDRCPSTCYDIVGCSQREEPIRTDRTVKTIRGG